MLSPGDTAPDFVLPGVQDGRLDTFRLSDYAGPNVVVLAFYPADFSPTCTDEMCSLRDIDLFTLQQQVAILGVSTDTAFSHRVFADQNSLRFPLLSDNDGSVTEQYGVRADGTTLDGHRGLAKRAVFVLDGDRTVHYAWVTDDPTDTPDLEPVREAVGDVADDDTAIERYRVAFEHYDEGRDTFGDAHTAYNAEDWLTASDLFDRSVGHLEDAADAFSAAARFAESGDAAAAARHGRDQSTTLRQAAKWFAAAAEYHATGEHELGDEYRDDARTPYETAVERDEPDDPDSLA